MLDHIPVVRNAYMTLLSTIPGAKVYYELVPDTAIPGVKYILVRSIISVSEDDKQAYNHNTSIVVECISVGNAVANITDNEYLVQQVFNLVDDKKNLDLSPNFSMINIRVAANEPFVMNDGTNKIYRRMIKFDSYISQL